MTKHLFAASLLLLSLAACGDDDKKAAIETGADVADTGSGEDTAGSADTGTTEDTAGSADTGTEDTTDLDVGLNCDPFERPLRGQCRSVYTRICYSQADCTAEETCTFEGRDTPETGGLCIRNAIPDLVCPGSPSCAELPDATLKAAFPSGNKQVGDKALVFWQMALEEFTCSFSITAELHFGMTLDQERQLFYFLNDLSRAVPSAVSQAFDQDNAINTFTHELIKDFIPMGLVSEKGQVDWEDPAWIRRDSLNAINAKLILNHGNIENAKSSVVAPRLEDARAFWTAILALPGITDRKTSLAAQPAMLKAIAKCFYDLKWARGSGRKALPEDIAEKFLAALPTVDFSVKNLVWRGGAKTTGIAHTDGSFRFSPTHNEIVPLLAAELRRATNTL
jgi:hypothetical protein